MTLSYSSSSDNFLGNSSFLLTVFILDQNELFPNQLFCFIPLVIDVEIAPRKKNPIINHKILSSAIADEKAWPDLIISVTGSKGSKFNLSNYLIIYFRKKNYKIKLTNKNNKNIRSY